MLSAVCRLRAREHGRERTRACAIGRREKRCKLLPLAGMRRALLLALSLWIGCAGAQTKRGSTAATESEPVAESPRAAEYHTDADGLAVRGNAADDVLFQVVRKACEGADLILDGRLGALAEALARGSKGAQRAPSYSTVSHEARRAGLVEPTPEVWLASGPDAIALSQSLRDQVRMAATRGELTHCGAGAVRERGGVVLALVLSGRFLSLAAPVPQRVSRGAQVSIKAELARGYRGPILAVTHPSGRVSREPLGQGRDIQHVLSFPESGVYGVELLATGPQGITVVANFPVGADADPNARPVESDEPVEGTAAEVAEHLEQAIARERKKRGLVPLKLDARLTNIALAHGTDMVEHGFIAHTSPSTGEAKDRVKRAGLNATIVLENIGRGYSAQEIHQGLMESPGHRGNVLHADVRELGIAVLAEREGSRTAFVATEVFTRLAAEIDVARAPAEVVRGVQAVRKRAGVKAVVLDERMSSAAQSAAERYAAQGSGENVLLERATRELGAPPGDIKAVAAALVLANELSQVWESARLKDPAVRRLGVGVAKMGSQSDHALVVVLLIGLAK
jgi:uncharacterized protein YkwD